MANFSKNLINKLQADYETVDVLPDGRIYITNGLGVDSYVSKNEAGQIQFTHDSNVLGVETFTADNEEDLCIQLEELSFDDLDHL